jgi:secreted PhoX family phosphatase
LVGKNYYDNPPEHYGWVVEIDPISGEAKKHTSMGRMAHECATTTSAKDGRVVVYTGDDTVNEHLYKFISDSQDNLNKGTLYVANLEAGDLVSVR